VNVKRALSLTATILLFLGLGALLLGQVLGQPVLLSFVETGSMEPAMDAGDGFVAVPAPIAGDVGVGDVVIYDAERIEGGGYVTHRVVGETDRGYVTRGDANPFTDQDSNEPPVRDAQVVAKALQVGGTVVTIPHLGTATMAFQSSLERVQHLLASLFGSRIFLGAEGIGFLIFGVSIIAYVVDVLVTGPSSDRDRTRSRTRHRGRSKRVILGGLALLIVTAATAAMIVPAGTQQYGIISAEFDSERPDIIRTGESEDLTYATQNTGFVPVYVYLEALSDGVDVQPRRHYVGSQSEATATVTLDAPPETGYYREFVKQYRYLAVLPGPIIHSLHETHPWVAIGAIDAFLGGGFYALGALLFGHRGRVRLRGQSRDGAGRTGVRVLRSLYR